MSIRNFLKSVFSGPLRDPENIIEPNDLIMQAVEQIPDRTYWYHNKAVDYPVFRDVVMKFTDKEKVDFILQQVQNVHVWNEKRRTQYVSEVSQKSHIAKAFIDQLFRSKMDLSEQNICDLAAAFIRYKKHVFNHVLGWPVKAMVGIVQKKYKGGILPASVENALWDIKNELSTHKKGYYDKQSIKVTEQIDTVIFEGKGSAKIKPVLFLGEDEFKTYANTLIIDLPEDEKNHWYKLITICQKANGSSPSKKFLTDGRLVIDELGVDKFKLMLSDWFAFIVKMKERQVPNQYYLQYHFLASVNAECIKGFVWQCISCADKELIQNIAALTDRVYRKIPGQGQTCTILGNAGIYTLHKVAGLDGISHLSRLKLKVKQASTQSLIEKYILQAANDRNIAPDAIEDLSIDDFAINNGTRQVEMGDFTALVGIEKIGKVSLTWQKKDGTVQKAEPALVKEKFASELKKLKADCKQIESTLSAQRNRLDRSLRGGRKLSWQHFKQYYFEHGLVSFIAHKLIWRFEKPAAVVDAMYLTDEWTDTESNSFTPDDSWQVSLWHPAAATLQQVRQWRTFLIGKEIQQPIKQAFREIYLLTDAEVNTNTYSNRMAGHILKQHQLNSLAKARGWRYSLQGAFDGGDNGTANLTLPEYNLVAEYWTNGIDTANGINGTGIFNYVSTDQIRFKNALTSAAIELIDVPLLAFTEVMRDVDLFVGVASIGNDPSWRDSGELPQYANYWQRYAFGDLNEISKGRKEILERLVPRLKIAHIASVTDKFLVVKGKKRTYKIHMGSTNILMEPNDQYLCIVPDRGKSDVAQNVFLPFEGDNGLSIILSKAFLLADDDKITDITITRQIDR